MPIPDDIMRSEPWQVEPCEKHEMIACSLCKPKPTEPTFRRGTTRYDNDSDGVIEAQFSSVCPACRNSIYVGDPIKPNERHEWVHEVCA